jgi:hypothetical protein
MQQIFMLLLCSTGWVLEDVGTCLGGILCAAVVMIIVANSTACPSGSYLAVSCTHHCGTGTGKARMIMSSQFQTTPAEEDGDLL